MDGEHRRLDRKGREEGEEDEHAVAAGGLRGRFEEQALGALCASRERDDAHEHDEPAEKRVEDELDRGARCAFPAVPADEEVHRQDHELEEDIEKEDVARGENADHHCF